MAGPPRRTRTLSSGGFAANLTAMRKATDSTRAEMMRIFEQMQKLAKELTPNERVAEAWEIVTNRDDSVGRLSISLVNTSDHANRPLTNAGGGVYPAPTGQTGAFTLLDLWDMGYKAYTIRPFKKKYLKWVDDKTGETHYARKVEFKAREPTRCISAPRELGERLIQKLRERARGEFRFTKRGRARRF